MKARESLAYRLFYTLKYHRASQLLRRLHSRCLGRFSSGPSSFDDHRVIHCASRKETIETLLSARMGAVQAKSSFEGKLEFLGRTVEVGYPVRWSLDDKVVDHLWRFQLHYQEFLLEFVEQPEVVEQLIVSWIKGYNFSQLTRQDGWHPFCISKRLAVWSLIANRLDRLRNNRLFLSSLFQQAEFLSRNLEKDIGGNHLLENARGLAFAATVLKTEESKRWMQVVSSILDHEIPRQLLDHGEHFERSSSYHVEVWHLLLELSHVLRFEETGLARKCNDAAERMGQFVKRVQCPDGSMPMFGDSNKISDRRIRACLELQVNSSASLDLADGACGDYKIWSTSGDYLIFDAGVAGPDHLPAHMHCDLLGLELWVGGAPLLVDPGVFDYADSEMRKYCRGTKAHSVLQIDQTDQFHVWSRFRVGYRGHTSGLRCGATAGFEWAESTHNAYRRLGIKTVGRRIFKLLPRSWVCVDWIGDSTAGPHALESRLHLHPSVEIVRFNGECAILRVGGEDWTLKVLGADLELEEGYYCHQMGSRCSTNVLAARLGQVKRPIAIGWYLFPGQDERPVALKSENGCWQLSLNDVQIRRRLH